MTNRRILATMVIAWALGCAQAPEPVIEITDSRSPLKKLADSTRIALKVGVDVSDSASLRAQLAAAERDSLRRRLFVGEARRSAMIARESFIQAIERGDRLRDYMTALPGDDQGSRHYSRYWGTSRERIDFARSESHLAMQAADSALVCSMVTCSAAMAAALRTHMMAAAGAAHEAHSLLRIAMTYLR